MPDTQKNSFPEVHIVHILYRYAFVRFVLSYILVFYSSIYASLLLLVARIPLPLHRTRQDDIDDVASLVQRHLRKLAGSQSQTNSTFSFEPSLFQFYLVLFLAGWDPFTMLISYSFFSMEGPPYLRISDKTSQGGSKGEGVELFLLIAHPVIEKAVSSDPAEAMTGREVPTESDA